MKAAIFRKNGAPHEVIEIVDDEIIPPKNGEVLIEVEAAPIHLGDLYNMQGLEGFKLPLPSVPGIEGVGRIVELGKGVKNFSIGNRVLFLSSAHVDGFIENNQGTWRQNIRLSSDILIPAPEGDPAQYANIVNPATAYVFIHDVTKPKKGEWIIQNAANSNVGRYLIKVAKDYGCRTINIVRRPELIEELKELGGDEVILDSDNLSDQIAKLTKNADIRFALDALAGEAPARLGCCLSNGGIVYNYGLVSKKNCQMPTWLMLNKDIKLQGFFAGTQFVERSLEGKKSLVSDLATLISEGKMPSKIAGTYPLNRIKDALIHAADSGASRDGKVILLPNS